MSTCLKYTKLNALRSMWHSASFGMEAKQRLIKAFLDYKDPENRWPQEFLFNRSFFCSYFVSYCHQTAEALRHLPKLMDDRVRLAKGFTPLDTALIREVWARYRSFQVKDGLDTSMTMKFDPKRFMPQEFRNYALNHPEYFTDFLRIKGRTVLQPSR